MSFPYPNDPTFPENTQHSYLRDTTQTVISDSWEREAFQSHQRDQYNHSEFSSPNGFNQNHSISGDRRWGSASVPFSAPLTPSYPYGVQGSAYQMLPEMTPSPHSSATKPKRKPLYLWDEQENPELEEKRRRAIKAFKNRQKNYKKEDDLERHLYDLEQEVNALHNEKYSLQCTISQYEDQLHHGFPQQGQSGDGSFTSFNEDPPF
ncbi:uncharacterized protein LOC135207102 [Macrobrachium nipponense]|uniref:uncharacterized protein LOC135207102 n=1 Tax=Macrobrachium nipponense TaxID=159736 RepID=UPI0030C8AAA8